LPNKERIASKHIVDIYTEVAISERRE